MFKKICISHDIEENYGHKSVVLDKDKCVKYLKDTLEIEKNNDVMSNYNIVGILFEKNYPLILNSNLRHSIGFHTYNHDVNDLNQLQKVRQINLQIKGYRPAQSNLTSELSDYNLSFYNFEWLICSFYKENFLNQDEHMIREIKLENGIVKIPMILDDHLLFRKAWDFNTWKNKIFEHIDKNELMVLGLHDCYSDLWINHYDSFLKEMKTKAEFITCEEIKNRIFLYGKL